MGWQWNLSVESIEPKQDRCPWLTIRKALWSKAWAITKGLLHKPVFAVDVGVWHIRFRRGLRFHVRSGRASSRRELRECSTGGLRLLNSVNSGTSHTLTCFKRVDLILHAFA